jgi:6-phosphofructokinase 1
MRLGVLTGGGDAPGLNAVIRGIVIKANQLGYSVTGFLSGWRSMLDGKSIPLGLEDVETIVRKGGTILGTSRTNLAKIENGMEKAKVTLKSKNIDCLIAIGGEDTLGVAAKLFKSGVNTIGVPKTIDNDLESTDYTFGFDTAINIAMECLDRLHTTAESHHRVMVVELMGRHAGWIALEAGIAGDAHIILIPEQKFDVDEICNMIQKRVDSGKTYTIIAVSEGALPKSLDQNLTKDNEVDSFGHIKLGGIAEWLAKQIEQKTKQETRHTVLGHIQRGGAPSAFDRVLGTRMGLKAVALAEEKKFGQMVSLRGTELFSVSLEEGVKKLKTVSEERYAEARILMGK